MIAQMSGQQRNGKDMGAWAYVESEALAPLARNGADAPLVVGQIGQSLDGRLATVTGCARDINGAAALDHLHRLRAAVDAVVVGIGTVLNDDPQLTVRRVEGANPTRVIVDPNARLPEDVRCLGDGHAANLVLRARGNSEAKGCETLFLPHDNGHLDPRDILAALASRGLKRVLIEGGPTTLGHFLAAGTLDRLHILVAPLLIGSGLASLALPEIASLDSALRPPARVFVFDDGDVLFDCDLRADEIS